MSNDRMSGQEQKQKDEVTHYFFLLITLVMA